MLGWQCHRRLLQSAVRAEKGEAKSLTSSKAKAGLRETQQQALQREADMAAAPAHLVFMKYQRLLIPAAAETGDSVQSTACANLINWS